MPRGFSDPCHLILHSFHPDNGSQLIVVMRRNKQEGYCEAKFHFPKQRFLARGSQPHSFALNKGHMKWKVLRSTQCWGLEGGRDGNKDLGCCFSIWATIRTARSALQLEEKRGLGKSLWPVLYHSVTWHLASEPPAVYCTLSIDHSSKTVALLWLRLKFSLNERSLSSKVYLCPALSCPYCSDAHTHHDAF